MELSGNRSAQTKQLLTDASELASVEQEMQRTEAGIAGAEAQLAAHGAFAGRADRHPEGPPLASLTVPQRQAVTSRSIGANGGSRSRAVHRADRDRRARAWPSPTPSSAARTYTAARVRASADMTVSGLAQARLGGGGPGVRAIATGSGRPAHVPLSSIEPGDLLIYNGEGHVAVYVGGGYVVDAPQTGMNVEKIPEHAVVRQQPRRSAAPLASSRGRCRAAGRTPGQQRYRHRHRRDMTTCPIST